ncbi:hypothetical protein BGZ82_009886 [Podila clonocystis]|nr:hypothetical protein BGZ82_009886 [Podila clonocystis]
MASDIGQYLSRSDISACIRVSRTCEALFTPVLWRDLSLEDLEVDSKVLPPGVVWRAQLVRHLSLTVDTLIYGLDSTQSKLLKECSNVEHFTIEPSDPLLGNTGKLFKQELWVPLTKFLKSNPRIRRVDLRNVMCRYSNDFLQALAELPELEHFQADAISMEGHQLAKILRLLPAHPTDNLKIDATRKPLKTVRLTLFSLVDQVGLRSFDPKTTLSGLTHLALNDIVKLDWEEQRDLIRRCPNLVSLDWFHNDRTLKHGEFRVAEFCSKILTSLPHLKEIGLYSIFEAPSGAIISTLFDRHFPRLLKALPPNMERFKVPDSGLAFEGFQELKTRPFFTTIRELDFDDCNLFTGEMALECLQQCSGLTKFTVRWIAADVMMKTRATATGSKPWACRNLTYLQGRFIGMLPFVPARAGASQTAKNKYKESLQQHQLVFEKLGALTHLEHLDIGVTNLEPGFCEYDANPSSCDLRLSLTTGLDLLSDLKKLRYLHIEGLAQQLTQADADWIVKNWPLLEDVIGQLHPDLSTHFDLLDKVAGKWLK